MTRNLRATLTLLAVAALPLAVTAQTPTLKLRGQSSEAAVPAETSGRAAAYYHYGLAKIYENQAEQNGRQDIATQAIEQYKLALDADPGSRILQDGIANLYFRLGRIREAVSAAQDQVNKHPDDVDAHILLGRVYLRSLGDGQGPQSPEVLKAAIKEYETIVKLKPDDLETRLLLGQLYGLNHDSAKAEEQFKAAQRLDGSNEEVVLNLARQYSEQGELDHAAQAIADVPEDDRTSREDFALAGLYDQLKRPKDAAAAYHAVLDEDPDNLDAKKGLAAALTAAGETDAAAKIYADILSNNPQDPQSLINEADLERQQGDFEKSLATLKKAQALDAGDIKLNFDLALDYDALGRFAEAIATLKQILAATASSDGKYTDSDRSNRALFLDRLGIAARAAGQTEEAIGAYKQMAGLGGDYQPRAYAEEVQTYRDAHQWDKALQAAAEAAKALPENHNVQLTYASQLGDAGRVEEAIRLANAQLSHTPDDREVYFTLADIEFRAKRWKDAAAALDKAEALATKPEEKAFLDYDRGDVALREKMYDQAETEFRKGLALDPDNAAIQNDLGYMFADRGIHLDEAVTMLKKAVAADPQNYAYLDSLAWAYYKQGQYALAEDYERRAALRSANDPTVLDHLGEIEARNGKLQQAIGDWQRSLQAYASSLPPDADPADVAKVQHKLEGARVRLAHAAAPAK
jgi:tetratricopeptide (TPR) repeat protein